ncbi:MAG: inositol monophosphatase [Acidobacteriota bacterium]|nr:inositol monophosphatase [Acidobacteriota bacterium]MDQ5872339.1 inositol monophosphatase [Acidobacteriota bacterium]
MSAGGVAEAAQEAARAGGEVLERYWRRLPGAAIEEKKKNDFVTRADRESEEVIVARLRARFPEDGFLGEEGGQRGAGGEARTWIVDPLDGTSNFIAGFPFWCVSVAAREGREIVAGAVWDPLRREMYAAERGGGAFRNGERISVSARSGLDGAFLATGFPFRHKDRVDLYLSLFRRLFLQARAIRRAGSAALDLANVAAGVFDGFFEFRLSVWDIAAGALLIEEAGGRVSDFDGRDGFWERGNVVAGNPGVADEILRAAAGLFSDGEI